jgi:hypothetical protein
MKLVENVTPITRAVTPEEIAAWAAERRAALTELLAQEQQQLSLEDVERRAA